MPVRWTCLIPVVFFVTAQAAAAEPAARTASGSGWGWIGAAAVVTVLILLAAGGWLTRWYLQYRKRAERKNPRGLLRELCRAHNLSRRAEGLLAKAAAAVGTPHPGRLFLEPKLLRAASRCRSMAGSRRALHLLYEELFGEFDEAAGQ